MRSRSVLRCAIAALLLLSAVCACWAKSAPLDARTLAEAHAKRHAAHAPSQKQNDATPSLHQPYWNPIPSTPGHRQGGSGSPTDYDYSNFYKGGNGAADKTVTRGAEGSSSNIRASGKLAKSFMPKNNRRRDVLLTAAEVTALQEEGQEQQQEQPQQPQQVQEGDQQQNQTQHKQRKSHRTRSHGNDLSTDADAGGKAHAASGARQRRKDGRHVSAKVSNLKSKKQQQADQDGEDSHPQPDLPRAIPSHRGGPAVESREEDTPEPAQDASSQGPSDEQREGAKDVEKADEDEQEEERRVSEEDKQAREAAKNSTLLVDSSGKSAKLQRAKKVDSDRRSGTSAPTAQQVRASRSEQGSVKRQQAEQAQRAEAAQGDEEDDDHDAEAKPNKAAAAASVAAEEEEDSYSIAVAQAPSRRQRSVSVANLASVAADMAAGDAGAVNEKAGEQHRSSFGFGKAFLILVGVAALSTTVYVVYTRNKHNAEYTRV